MEAKTTIIIIFYRISCTPYYMHRLYHQTPCEGVEGRVEGRVIIIIVKRGGRMGEIW